MTDPLTPTFVAGSRRAFGLLVCGAGLLAAAPIIALAVIIGLLADTRGERDGLRGQVEAQNVKIDCLSRVGAQTNLALLANASAQNQLILGGFQSVDVTTYVAQLNASDRRVKTAEAVVADLKTQCNLE